MPIVFEGPVNIYLQGQNALAPISPYSRQRISYHIGSDQTALTLHDQRDSSINSAIEIWEGIKNIVFAKTFNQPAIAKITWEEITQSMEIILLNNSQPQPFPLLWMGVIERGCIPAYEVEWEIYKPFGIGKIAFVALIPEQGGIEINDSDRLDILEVQSTLDDHLRQ